MGVENEDVAGEIGLLWEAVHKTGDNNEVFNKCIRWWWWRLLITTTAAAVVVVGSGGGSALLKN